VFAAATADRCSLVNGRDLAVVALRCLAVWFGVRGIVGLAAAFAMWGRTVAEVGREWATASLAEPALYIPLAALVWVGAKTIGQRTFPGGGTSLEPFSRNDLFSFGVFFVGLLLLAEAVPNVVYWAVYLRATRDTSVLAELPGWQDGAAGEYAATFQGEIAATACRVAIGVACVAGPQRLARWLGVARRELFESKLTEPDSAPGRAGSERE
jgi:hypothetical protein